MGGICEGAREIPKDAIGPCVSMKDCVIREKDAKVLQQGTASGDASQVKDGCIERDEEGFEEPGRDLCGTAQEAWPEVSIDAEAVEPPLPKR